MAIPRPARDLDSTAPLPPTRGPSTAVPSTPRGAGRVPRNAAPAVDDDDADAPTRALATSDPAGSPARRGASRGADDPAGTTTAGRPDGAESDAPEPGAPDGPIRSRDGAAAPGVEHDRNDRRATLAGGIALLALAAVLLEAAADVLPDEPVVGVFTPVRLAVLAGLVALLAARARPRSAFDPALGLLLLAAAVATVVAGQPWAPWRAVLTTVAVFYLALGVRRVLPDAGRALGLLSLLAVAAAGSAGLRQAANGTDTGFCRGALDGSADVCTGAELVRVTGTLANPNLLAALLVLLLPIAAAGAAALADRPSRLLGSAVVALGYAALLLTGSRGGILAGLVGVAALVVLRRPTRRRLVAAGAAGLAAPAALAVLTGGRFGVRTDVWAAAMRIAVENPLGVGPARAGALVDAAVPGDEPFAHAHDLWLNWAVETGVAGLLAVLAITALAGFVAVRAAARGSVAAAACGAGLAGFAVLSLADHPANTTRIAIVLFAVLGALAAEPLRRAGPVRTSPS